MYVCKCSSQQKRDALWSPLGCSPAWIQTDALCLSLHSARPPIPPSIKILCRSWGLGWVTWTLWWNIQSYKGQELLTTERVSVPQKRLCSMESLVFTPTDVRSRQLVPCVCLVFVRAPCAPVAGSSPFLWCRSVYSGVDVCTSRVGLYHVLLLLMFMSIGRDHVSELRPPTGLLFIPRVMYDCENGGMILTGENRRTLEENLSQCPHGLIRARIRPSAVRCWLLTSWAMVWPLAMLLNYTDSI
jgi:hypothetical protein